MTTRATATPSQPFTHTCGQELTKVGAWHFYPGTFSKIVAARQGKLLAEDYLNWAMPVCPCCGEKL